MKVGSLFSGGGLGDFGFLMAGCEIVFQVEIDEYCQKILQLRYPDAKRFRDIRSVNGKELPRVDIITGGFPCQPFSVAGKQNGTGDNRHLWPEMSRIISEVGPSWVVAENVPGIIDLALDDVLDDLEGKGYETITLVFPAHAFGAPHRRDRVWIVGYSEHARRVARKEQGGAGTGNDDCSAWSKQASQPARSNKQHEVVGTAGLFRQTKHEKQATGIKQSGENVADADSLRSQGCRANKHQEGREGQDERPAGLCDVFTRWWEVEPAVDRVVNGCPRRVDRLKCLGNGQVCDCTRWIAENILKFEHLK